MLRWSARRPDAAIGEVAIQILSGEGRNGFAAIDEAAGDAEAFAVRVLMDRVDEFAIAGRGVLTDDEGLRLTVLQDRKISRPIPVGPIPCLRRTSIWDLSPLVRCWYGCKFLVWFRHPLLSLLALSRNLGFTWNLKPPTK